MCGIMGVLGSVTPEDQSRVNSMLKLMRHRGPDGGLAKSYSSAVLGHRRLSIIDLDKRGANPLETEDGRFSIVYNGEIYNYLELRSELSNFFTFRTETDTEVLLNGYRYWGEDVLHKLRGMFAFCIYDTQKHAAFLARDRFGQKPLVYFEDADRFIFASEVKAILCAGVSAQPDYVSWHSYLTQARYDHDDRTFFQDIKQLRPGECGRWERDKKFQTRIYYDLKNNIEPSGISYASAIESIRSLMVEVTRLHMRSDVPIGVSLSGGLDSSALLACLQDSGKLEKGLEAYFVDFGDSYSEKPWVEKACKQYELEANLLTFTQSEFQQYIRPMMWHLEGPLGGLMNCALTKIMKVAQATNVTVMQDGSGIDEAFGGYRIHHDMFLATLLANDDPMITDAIRDYSVNWGVTEDAALAAASIAFDHNNASIDGTLPVRNGLIRSDFLRTNSPQPNELNQIKSLKDSLCDYLQVSKIPRNTRMKDRSSMAFGIELRVPFLDHQLIEQAMALDPEYLFRGGASKAIVRDALSGILENDVRIAPKRTVHAPQGMWLRQEPMKSYVSALISSDSFADRKIFNVDAVKEAYKNFVVHGSDNSFFVWQWINTEEWFRTFIDNDAVQNEYPLYESLREIAA